MKIICVSPDDLSTLLFCKTLSRLLARRGDELITIGGQVEGLPVDLYREEIRREVVSRHIEIPMKRFISPVRDLAYLWKLYLVIRRERCSAVVTFTTKPNIYGQWAAFLAGVPLRVMAVRGLGRTFNTASTAKERAIQRMITILYKLACGVAHKVWFTNQGDLVDFVTAGICTQSKTFLTRNAVDLTDFCLERINPTALGSLRRELGLKPSDKAVVMVARLIEQKGVREFADAALALHGRLPGLHFLLVAPEEPENPSMIPVAFVRERESCSNLRWLGFRKDVRELYALSDLSVLPSYYKEGGYPRALLEAMAYGKPVIAADTPECRGPVEDGRNGYLVPPRDASALTAAIEKIMTNPKLSSGMGRHSLMKMRKEFDDRAVFGMLIDEVLSPAAPRLE
jgi:glycosyltransferase involved in cell wall biosynthesis